MTTYKTIFSVSAALLLTAGAAHARHTDLDGRIKVHNERRRAVRLMVDGDFTARVGPGETRVLRHVPNGLRLVEVEGRRPRGDRLHKVAVPPHGVVHFTVKARRGASEVVNNSGIRMRVMVDGRSMGTVAPGRRLTTERMRPGNHQLVAVPAERGLPTDQVLRQTIRVEAGRTRPVRLGAWYATMVIRNSLSQRAKVFVDGQRVSRLRAGEALTSADMAPGRHTVELRRRGQVLARAIVRLAPGERERVSPAVMQGSVRVANRHHRPVEIAVDGVYRGRVEGRSSRVFAGMTPGQHRVTVTDARGRSAQHRVRVRAGRAPTELALGRRGRGEYVARR